MHKKRRRFSAKKRTILSNDKEVYYPLSKHLEAGDKDAAGHEDGKNNGGNFRKQVVHQEPPLGVL